MKEGVVSILQADAIKPYDIATSKQLLSYLYKLYELNPQGASCRFDLDYDKDLVRNHQDNCPIVRNPSQSNMDNDSYGDVCDTDIDGDGILNPIGLVNDAGFINPTLYRNTQVTYDNCPTVPNDNQLDLNKNTIGDACE